MDKYELTAKQHSSHLASRYRLGLPAWGFPGWRDRYFYHQPSALTSYAKVFNAVEGNTTFYGIPSIESVQSWRQALVDSDLTISFKLPRTITHEKTPSQHDLSLFFKRIAPLEHHIGPLLLQFPATVGPRQLGFLNALFAKLPREHYYVVEVRHQGFFLNPELLEPSLNTYGFSRVAMDTRAIFQGNRQHPEVLGAIHDKPDVPVLDQIYHDKLFVRLLLHPDGANNSNYIAYWATRFAQSLSQGLDCTMMIHCPNNMHCPVLAVEFHEALRKRMTHATLPSLPSWPVPQQSSFL